MTEYTISNESEWNTIGESLVSGDTVKLTASFTFTTTVSSSERIIMVDGVTFDGQGYVLTLASGNHSGLFELPTTSAPNCNIQNVGVVADAATISNGAIFVYTNEAASNGNFYNCYAHGPPQVRMSGQTGGFIGRTSGSINVNFYRCYFSGFLPDYYNGGIIGFAYNFTGTINIEECYSLSDVGNGGVSKTGGIFGTIWTGSGTINITNCYHHGTISSTVAGGMIYMEQTSDITYTVNINNCYSTGTRLVGCGSTTVAGRLFLSNSVAQELSNEDESNFGNNDNNSETVEDIQGDSFNTSVVSAGWQDQSDTWTAGTDSSYPTLD